MIHFLIVAAARPNFMKVAPVMEAFRNWRSAETHLVHTGQHYDASMSDAFFTDLGMTAPEINLGVGSGTHAQQTAGVMTAFEPVCTRLRPDCVVVVGDVNSTVACALTAKKLGIAVAHIEAGLRSRDMSMPEEVNRICTDSISDFLFTTDEIAGANLRREGHTPEQIHFVGNTMIDTLYRHIERARSMALPAGVVAGEYAVLTLHRPANVDSPEVLTRLLGTINEIAARVPIIFPIHPRTKARIQDSKLDLDPRIQLLEPLSYLPFLSLISRCRMVLTDSGGVQEETTVLGIPCITLRTSTERPITCQMGTNVLVGNDPAQIREAAFSSLNGRPVQHRVPEKWDGHAAERIVEILAQANSLVAAA